MEFNKPVKILTESFKLSESLETNNNGDQQKHVKMQGLALTLGKPTRNGVIYSLQDSNVLESMVGKPFLDTHNDNSALNTFGHVEKFWKEGNNLMYQVDLDPEETKFVRKAKRGDLPGVSVQVLCDTAEEQMDGNIHANIESFLELSAVTIPGEGDSSATLLEAFGRKPKGLIKKFTGAINMKEEYPKQDMPPSAQDKIVNPRDDLQEEKPKKKETSASDFSMTRCIKKMAAHMDEPGAFCRWAYDRNKKKYGEAVGDDVSDYDMDEFYTDYEEYVKESIRYGKEDLTTAPNSGGALVGGQPVKKREEAVEEVKDIIENEAGKKEERIYDPLAKKAIKPNYEGEDELESTLDNIQDTGNTVTPEDKRNLIPGVKKAQKEIFKKLTDMNTRVKKVEIRKRIEKIEKKMEGIKYGKKA